MPNVQWSKIQCPSDPGALWGIHGLQEAYEGYMKGFTIQKTKDRSFLSSVQVNQIRVPVTIPSQTEVS